MLPLLLMAQRRTAQHSTAQHSTAQHSTAQHSTAQHSTAQHSTIQHAQTQASQHFVFCTACLLTMQNCKTYQLCVIIRHARGSAPALG